MAGSDKRTIWRAKPCGWRGRERVVALGGEFGPAGPMVLDLLEELAKEQRADGDVRAGLRSIARDSHLTRGSEGIELARRILAFAEKVGALDDLVIDDGDEMTVTCRVSGFSIDQGRGGAAVRKSQQRAEEQGPTAACDAVTSGVTNRDAVTVGHLTGEERRGQDRTEEAAYAADRSHGEEDEGEENASTSLLDENEAKRVARDRRDVNFRGKRVPNELVERGERLLEVFNTATGRSLAPRGGRGTVTPALKQILGALLDRPEEPEETWAAGIHAAIADPPGWAAGRPLQVGDLFGAQASEHTLSRGRGDQTVIARNGRMRPSDWQKLKHGPVAA